MHVRKEERSIVLLSRNIGVRRRGKVSNTPRSLYPRERSGALLTGDWVEFAAGLGRTVNLASTGIRAPRQFGL